MELVQEETHNLPETSKDGWRHSTPRPPEVVEISRCNNAGIEWYQEEASRSTSGRHQKVKSHLSHLREEMPLWKHLTPGQIIGLHIEVGRNVCWNKSNIMLVSQTQYQAGQPGKKKRHCTTLITQITLSSAVIQMQGQPPYQICGKTFYTASWQWPEASARQY